MLVLTDEAMEQLKWEREHATPEGRKSLEKNISYLQGYGCHDGDPARCVVTLFSCQQGQEFGVGWWFRNAGINRQITIADLMPEENRRRTMERYYHHFMSGGLVHHGAGSGGAGFPELAVRIGDCSHEEWSVHT